MLVPTIESVNFMNSIDISEFKERISIFRKLDIKDMNEACIVDLIKKSLLYSGRFIYPFITYSLKRGTKLFRVRKFTSDISSKNYEFWNPPTNMVKSYGRLNRPNESLLYTCLTSPLAAISESRLQKGDIFYLVIYQAIEDIDAVEIGLNIEFRINDEENTDNAMRVHRIFNDFLRDEFTKNVDIGMEHQYKVSSVIARYYYRFPIPPYGDDYFDAIKYPSVRSQNDWNVCLLPERAKELLTLPIVLLAEYNSDDDICPKKMINGFDFEGNALFSDYNSINLKELFPITWWRDILET